MLISSEIDASRILLFALSWLNWIHYAYNFVALQLLQFLTKFKSLCFMAAETCCCSAPNCPNGYQYSGAQGQTACNTGAGCIYYQNNCCCPPPSSPPPAPIQTSPAPPPPAQTATTVARAATAAGWPQTLIELRSWAEVLILNILLAIWIHLWADHYPWV